MALTTAQLQALKAEINGDVTLSSKPNNDDAAVAIAIELNKNAAPDFSVWATNVSVQAIFDAISWDKYTPVDVADATVIYSNRLLAIQTKQMNLQNMLVGRQTVDGSKANVRAGLRDAVIQLPSGTGGALVTAGGVGGTTVLAALQRLASRAEKVLAGGQATTGAVTANLLIFEGALSGGDVIAARNS